MTTIGRDNPDLMQLDELESVRGTAPDALHPPAWLAAFIGAEDGLQRARASESPEGLESSVVTGAGGALVSVRLRDAVDAPSDVLESRTVAAYQSIFRTLNGSRHRWPARVWNYIPHIHQPLDAERDRYMVFNSGRYQAYNEWFGGRDNFPGRVPTASGVGHRGTDLVVHCLAVERAGASIENPRQIPAFGYSRRYGPQPPCFARGTLLMRDGQPATLLVGGTASIRGEASMFPGSLVEQADETLANIASLVRAASADQASVLGAEHDDSVALRTLTNLRVYHPIGSDRGRIGATVNQRFPGAVDIEFVRADLCRAELLIEIEGVARLS